MVTRVDSICCNCQHNKKCLDIGYKVFCNNYEKYNK